MSNKKEQKYFEISEDEDGNAYLAVHTKESFLAVLNQQLEDGKEFPKYTESVDVPPFEVLGDGWPQRQRILIKGEVVTPVIVTTVTEYDIQ